MLNNVHYKNKRKNSTLKKKFGSFSFSFDFFASFCLFPSVFASDFFFVKQFFGSFSFHFDFFAILRSFSLQIFAVSLRCETSEIMLFFAANRNEIFVSITIFATDAKMRAYPTSRALRLQ